jgi:sugar O-acyltransferase (sialic acid O-acetyltransferase NeuD family)
MAESLIIIGTGGSAHDALDVIEAINSRSPTWKVAGFLDDFQPAGNHHLGLEVLGRLNDAPRFAEHWFLNVIGSDKSYCSRPEIIASTRLHSRQFATLIHPGASVSSRARLGHGVCVNFGVSIAGNVTVGDHVCLCPGVIVGHDTIVEDHALLAPGAVLSGRVHVGRAAYIGSGAKVRQGVRIDAMGRIGLGAVVLHDVPVGATVIGNPAKVLLKRK